MNWKGCVHVKVQVDRVEGTSQGSILTVWWRGRDGKGMLARQRAEESWGGSMEVYLSERRDAQDMQYTIKVQELAPSPSGCGSLRTVLRRRLDLRPYLPPAAATSSGPLLLRLAPARTPRPALELWLRVHVENFPPVSAHRYQCGHGPYGPSADPSSSEEESEDEDTTRVTLVRHRPQFEFDASALLPPAIASPRSSSRPSAVHVLEKLRPPPPSVFPAYHSDSSVEKAQRGCVNCGALHSGGDACLALLLSRVARSDRAGSAPELGGRLLGALAHTDALRRPELCWLLPKLERAVRMQLRRHSADGAAELRGLYMYALLARCLPPQDASRLRTLYLRRSTRVASWLAGRYVRAALPSRPESALARLPLILERTLVDCAREALPSPLTAVVLGAELQSMAEALCTRLLGECPDEDGVKEEDRQECEDPSLHIRVGYYGVDEEEGEGEEEEEEEEALPSKKKSGRHTLFVPREEEEEEEEEEEGGWKAFETGVLVKQALDAAELRHAVLAYPTVAERCDLLRQLATALVLNRDSLADVEVQREVCPRLPHKLIAALLGREDEGVGDALGASKTAVPSDRKPGWMGPSRREFRRKAFSAAILEPCSEWPLLSSPVRK